MQQVQRAHEIAGGKGAININVLWEMGGAQRILHGVLERTRGLVAGVTCGAGMPYKLSRDRRVLQRPLSADHQLGTRVPRAVEARLFEGGGMAGGGGLRGPVAGRRAQRPVERRGPAEAAGSLSARQGAARDDARRRHRRQRADRDGRRRLVSARLERLDRQSRTGQHRLPVRHAPAADAGKPDSAGVEGPADRDRGGRRAAPPLLADRLLFHRGAQPLPARASRRAASARSPSRRRKRATTCTSSTSA